MTSIPSFPAPSADIVEIATVKPGRLRAARLWANEARATLRDGSVVAPNMRLAVDVMKAIAKGAPACNIAVAEGKYEDAAIADARIAAEALKWERFHHFMAEDKPAEKSLDVCDSCGARTILKNHYAPDGMGYPSLVLQTCDDGFGCTVVVVENGIMYSLAGEVIE